jgi:hypothetical protein
VQVPFKLLQSCQQHPAGLQLLAQPCVQALTIFWRRALGDGILPDLTNLTRNTLTLRIGQQLQQAGFLQIIPDLLTAAAQQLEALQDSPETAAEAVADPLYSFARWHQSAAGQLCTLHYYVGELFLLLTMMRFCWPEEQLVEQICPALVCPLSHLVMRILQHASMCLDQLPPSMQEPPAQITAMMEKACDAARWCLLPGALRLLQDEQLPQIRPQQQQQQQQQRQQQQQPLLLLRQQLLRSPYPSQASCLLLVVHAYSVLLQYEQAGEGATGQSSTDGSSSSSSSTSREDPSRQQTPSPHASHTEPLHEHYRGSWQLASSSCDRVPPAHHQLLHALSCSSKVVLWAAALTRDTTPQNALKQQLSMVSSVYCCLVERREPLVDADAHSQWDVMTMLLHLPQQSSQRSLEWSEAEQVAHLLLPSVLLLWAANTPSNAADYLVVCWLSGLCSVKALQAWQQQERLRTVYVSDLNCQHLSQLASSTGGSGEPSWCIEEMQKLVSSGPADLQLVTEQIEEALRLTVGFILPQLLQLCQADISGSGSDRTRRQQRQQQQHEDLNVTQHEAFQQILNYLCILSDSPLGKVQQRISLAASFQGALFKPLAEDAAAAAASIVAATAAWSEHAVQLCSLLEAYVRLQGTRAAGGSLAGDDGGLALLCSRFMPCNLGWQSSGLLQAALAASAPAAGPGSPQQASLFSLLCSLLKYVTHLEAKHEGLLTDAILSAALAAASILQEQQTGLRSLTGWQQMLLAAVLVPAAIQVQRFLATQQQQQQMHLPVAVTAHQPSTARWQHPQLQALRRQ